MLYSDVVLVKSVDDVYVIKTRKVIKNMAIRPIHVFSKINVFKGRYVSVVPFS